MTALELYGIGNFLFMRAFNRYQILFLKGSDKISAVSLKKWHQMFSSLICDDYIMYGFQKTFNPSHA